MQYVNDDMDELFRRAAENYPLDTSSADWNKVLGALQGEGGTETDSEKKRNKNGRFLWLLLLLPLGLVCNQLYSPGIWNGNAISKSKKVTDNSSSANTPVTTGSEITTANANPQDNSHNNAITTPSKSVQEANFKEDNLATSSIPGVNNLNASKQVKGSNRKYSNSESSASASRSNKQNYSDNILMDEPAFLSRTYVSGIFSQNQLGEPVVTPTRSLNPLFEVSSHSSRQNIQVTKRKKFYAGIVGGIDATTIKFQKIENAGFNYGLLFGYQINKRWSIETGGLIERKYYYSDAKYFNTSKIYIPPNSWIDDVSGNCKMIEVPLAARYNFGFHKQSNWFSTLGISSYFMMNENYTYNYYYGTTGPVPHTKHYKNSSTDLFSNLSISGGYAHKLGNFADLRVEPYLKLPISGTGIGSLPLFSTGLQVGVTKKF